MTSAVEQKIRERAYAIWVAAGMPGGAEDENWMAAERAVLEEMSAIETDASAPHAAASAAPSNSKAAGKATSEMKAATKKAATKTNQMAKSKGDTKVAAAPKAAPRTGKAKPLAAKTPSKPASRGKAALGDLAMAGNA